MLIETIETITKKYITQTEIAHALKIPYSEVSCALRMFDAHPVGKRGQTNLYMPRDARITMMKYFKRKLVMANARAERTRQMWQEKIDISAKLGG